MPADVTKSGVKSDIRTRVQLYFEKIRTETTPDWHILSISCQETKIGQTSQT